MGESLLLFKQKTNTSLCPLENFAYDYKVVKETVKDYFLFGWICTTPSSRSPFDWEKVKSFLKVFSLRTIQIIFARGDKIRHVCAAASYTHYSPQKLCSLKIKSTERTNVTYF